MGYMMIDNRASGGVLVEKDTTFCRHCQAVIDKKKWREDGGIWKCSKCDGPVCHACTKKAAANGYACQPWRKQLEDAVKFNNELTRIRNGG